MNAPLIVRAPLRLAIAKGLKIDLEDLTDDAFRAFAEAVRYAEEALPELIAVEATSGSVFVLFVVRFDAVQLFIEFDSGTETFVITGFEMDDFDPPPSPAARREIGKVRVRTILARPHLESYTLLLDDEFGVPAKPSRPLARAVTARPGSAYALPPAGFGAQKALDKESGLVRERRPRRRSVFFGKLGIPDPFATGIGWPRGIGALSFIRPSSDVADEDRSTPDAIIGAKKGSHSAVMKFAEPAKGVAVSDCSLSDAPSLSSPA